MIPLKKKLVAAAKTLVAVALFSLIPIALFTNNGLWIGFAILMAVALLAIYNVYRFFLHS